jgi:ribA/ribD-fused uncharacterized protein
MINEFQGEYRWLSNFWIAPMVIDGKRYRSVEHYFQAMKADSDVIHEIIRNQRTPGDAKRFAKTIALRPGWNSMRLNIMLNGVNQKFEQNLDLKKKLIMTNPQELVEGNRWHDTFWGVDSETGKGENQLGKILMTIRERFMNE